MVDLDHFKQVNDTLGHDAGDEVLRSFGTHLRAQVRDGDVVGRLGGEEFVLLFPRTDRHEAVSILQRIARRWPDVAPHRLTFSAGAVTVEVPPDPHELPGQHALKRADALMYRAKESGRNVTLWE
jgi:diguanylate cyclase (GGDEF)-like protein